MKHAYKRLFSSAASAVLCGSMLFGLLPMGALTASALDYGPMKYKDYGDHIEILSCEKDITELVIPEEIDGVPVTKIASSLCSSAKYLEAVSLPSTLESIGEMAFWYCTKLESIIIPSSVQSLGGNMFQGCTSLKHVILEEGVPYISGCMFYQCSSLQEIMIPDSVTIVKGSAFYNCSSLRTVRGGANVTEFESHVFARCPVLKDISFGDKLKSIGLSTFYDSGVETITLPYNVNSIGMQAFAACSELMQITFENPNCFINNSVTTIYNETASSVCFYNGVIYGYNNSTAQKYAKDYGCKFISMNDGDINLDGDVNLVDGVLLARAIGGAEMSSLTPRGLRHAELDGEEGLGQGDLTLLLRKLAGW